MSYEFMFNSYNGPDVWQINAEREAAARKRGTAFTNKELGAILKLWAGVMDGHPVHEADRLTIPGKTATAIIQRDRIRFEGKPSREQMQTTMAHIADQWGGSASLPKNADRNFRLQAHAYAQVFGITLNDPNGKLSKSDLAKVAGYVEAARKAHPDAPEAAPKAEAVRPGPRTPAAPQDAPAPR